VSFRRLLMVIELTVDPEADDSDVAVAVEDSIAGSYGVSAYGVRSIRVGLPHMHLPKAVVPS
jgi:hypothetical protein